jgi:hypothetical protein
VDINGNKMIRDLDLTAAAGFATAVEKTFVCEARNGSGIDLKFIATKGNALINGIRVVRN